MENQSNKNRACLKQKYAELRSQLVKNVSYNLHFIFFENQRTFDGLIKINFDFDLSKNQTKIDENSQIDYILLDYAGKSISQIVINGKEIIMQQDMWHDNFIKINIDQLKMQQNVVEIIFQGNFHNDGLGIRQVTHPVKNNYQNNTLIYTLFPTNNAHRVFPCFDQPDIKAKFSLLIDAPQTWTVISIQMENFQGYVDAYSKQSMDSKVVLSRWYFEQTPLISTYLFSFVMGDLSKVERDIQYGQNKAQNIKLRLFSRAQVGQILENQMEEISFIIQHGLTFFENFFQTPYPFSNQKYDQVFCPQFHYAGMENPGLVCFTENYLITEQKSTNIHTTRASSILHELSHMWFGNLVTMKWWNDIWLNESFATYISYLCLSEVDEFRTKYMNPWIKFCEYKSNGFNQDSKLSTHSIAQEIESTDVSMEIYDSITYSKGAGIIKQLVFLIGLPSFQSFLHLYFQRYQWQNASMHDFFSMIQLVLKQDKKFENFNIEMWIDQYICKPSFNVISFKQDILQNTITFFQKPYHEKNHPYLRFQSFKVRLYNQPLFTGDYEDMDVFFSSEQVVMHVDFNKKQSVRNGYSNQNSTNNQLKCVLINYEDHSYIQFELDDFSRFNFLSNFCSIDDELTQIILLQHFSNEVQLGKLAIQQFIQSFLAILDKAHNSENIFVQTIESMYNLIEMLPNSIQKIESEKVFYHLLSKIENIELSPMIVTAIIDKISWFGSSIKAQEIMKSWIMNQYEPLKKQRWNNYVLIQTIENIFQNRYFTKEERNYFINQRLKSGITYRQFCEICEYEFNELMEIWNKFQSKSYQDQTAIYEISLQMRAFNNPANQQIQEFLSEAFFQVLEKIFNEANSEYAKKFYQKLFPKQGEINKLLKKVDDLLNKADISVILRSLLQSSYSKLEEQQNILLKYNEYQASQNLQFFHNNQ
ncbi:peptidase M1 family protein (macronuclear) [Tetrahymena thermophila SB210]|uniref:Peptidase M1 family protein n=1 Tax=Tetrahymena thermophila (strain SB210) TaxID=312017 RepID=I7MA72_TETTS|nr:peptidase M1 family protein [Tetrahymena thermophila SB210]EAS03838.2 peptidase M1 family protein [Tetrahymena thermophila SB210]|eukprot:XP_001024083.2 peptidase M1 family protein [Tetrahymena thermophila SB210]